MKWQLSNAVLPDGAWPSSNRYHGAVLHAYIPFGIALWLNPNRVGSGGWNPFATKEMQSFVSYYARVMTMPDRTTGNARFNTTRGCAVIPGVGDADWGAPRPIQRMIARLPRP
jgi:hypothetical protein